MLPYQLEGRGYPLLLIHGWGVTHRVWRNLVPLLAPHFQLILVELSGKDIAGEVAPDKSYYRACAEALEELRMILGIEQWGIMAYSTGTRVCEAYVQQYPQRVARAVFLCPIYLRKPWKLSLEVMQWTDSMRLGAGNWFLSGWRLYWLVLWFGFNLHRCDDADDWMREITLRPLDNLKRILLELPGKGRDPFLLPSSPIVPALFVWGLQDVLVAFPHHPRPNDVFIYAGHGAPVLTPHCVAEVVMPFLNESNAHPGNWRETLIV